MFKDAEKATFKEWLQKRKKLSIRSSRDVLSRLNRAVRLMEIRLSMKEGDILEGILQKEEFKRLNSDVKSQIKRAIHLYKEYENFNNTLSK